MSDKLKEYKASIQDQADSQSLAQYLTLVRRTAVYLKPRLSPIMDIDDMVQIGMMGLMEAKSSFDDSFGISFEAYAKIKIRGSIIDEVRSLSSITRLALDNKRKHEAAARSLAADLGRLPTNREVAVALEISLEEYEHQRSHANSFDFQELDPMLENDGFDLGDQSPDALQILVNEENKALLNEAIKGLDERKRIILSLYYVNEMNLKEIAAIIGVNESRISQLLKATVKELRILVAKK
jgi:RNA polymerase sigma factor for flagellar operon FliA